MTQNAQTPQKAAENVLSGR